jgi:hypothetical protein
MISKGIERIRRREREEKVGCGVKSSIIKPL